MSNETITHHEVGSEFTTVKIGGVEYKIETASLKRVTHLKVGGFVRVLSKEYSSYKTFLGVVLSIDPFEKLPTARILTVDDSYGSGGALKTIAINDNTEDFEVLPMDPGTAASQMFDRARVLDKIKREIHKHEEGIVNLEEQREAYEKYFGQTVLEAFDSLPNPTVESLVED